MGTGDFFSDDLPKADLYILSRILHDWSDEKVDKLLSKLSKACTPGKNIRSADLTISSKLYIYLAIMIGINIGFVQKCLKRPHMTHNSHCFSEEKDQAILSQKHVELCEGNEQEHNDTDASMLEWLVRSMLVTASLYVGYSQFQGWVIGQI